VTNALVRAPHRPPVFAASIARERQAIRPGESLLTPFDCLLLELETYPKPGVGQPRSMLGSHTDMGCRPTFAPAPATALGPHSVCPLTEGRRNRTAAWAACE